MNCDIMLFYVYISKLEETPSNLTTFFGAGEQISGDCFFFTAAPNILRVDLFHLPTLMHNFFIH